MVFFKKKNGIFLKEIETGHKLTKELNAVSEIMKLLLKKKKQQRISLTLASPLDNDFYSHIPKAHRVRANVRSRNISS